MSPKHPRISDMEALGTARTAPVIMSGLARAKDFTGNSLSDIAPDRLLRYLDAEPRCAEEKYLILRQKLIRYFDHNGGLDPEEAADEVFLRAVECLSQGLEIFAENPVSFIYGIARKVRMEGWRRKPMESLDALGDLKSPVVGSSGVVNAAFLSQCLDRLEPRERAELMLWYSEGVNRTSRLLRMSPNAVRVRICRIRKKLRELAGAPEEGAGGGA